MTDNLMVDNAMKIEKIKAIRPQIIVTGTAEKPYYEILYYDTTDKIWHIGYSSYDLPTVIKWKEECFEVVGEIEDMQPTADVAEVKHGKWIKRGNEKKCSVCGFIYYSNNDDWNGCPNCLSKMDGKDTNVPTK